MLDNRHLRRQLDDVVANLARRGADFDRELYLELESRRRASQVKMDELLAERNRLSALMQAGSAQERVQNLKLASSVKQELVSVEEEFRSIKAEQDEFLLGLPNLLLDDVPDGRSEADNRLVRESGSVPIFDFEPKNHFDLCPRDMDFAAAARTAGSRFVVLRGELARLQRALAQWMLNTHVDRHGYEEAYVPYIVEASSLTGTGQLPKFAGDLFRVSTQREQYLIPTGEVPLTNLMRECIIDEAELPMRLVAHTPCFRSEAGSYGKDTAGMFRQHQFEKVELVQICHPELSTAALLELLGHAEVILKELGLAYRVVQLCAADTGFASACTYDLEVWLPGQQRYREISSCSSFTDFQARRAAIRCRARTGEKPRLAHTVNGSGLAVGRALIAVIENFQTADGRMAIPAVLQPFMGGAKEMRLR